MPEKVVDVVKLGRQDAPPVAQDFETARSDALPCKDWQSPDLRNPEPFKVARVQCDAGDPLAAVPSVLLKALANPDRDLDGVRQRIGLSHERRLVLDQDSSNPLNRALDAQPRDVRLGEGVGASYVPDRMEP